MEYRTLGQTGLRVSCLTIGTWQLAGPVWFDGRPDGHPDPGEETVIRMIRELGDLGINAIDTAEQYGDGEAERRVGRALAGQRGRWVISTKFGYRVGPNQTRIDDASPATILPSLEGSLRRLGTDCVDVLLYHCAPRPGDIAAGREVLERARRAGKVRATGISTTRCDLVETLLAQDAVQVVQYPANLLQDRPDLRALAARHDLGLQVRGVLAQGRLSGRYLSGAPTWDRDDSRRHRCAGDDLRRYAPLAALLPSGWTLAQAAIRWALDRPEHHTICLGAKSLADYRAAIAALERGPLAPDLTRRLEACARDLGPPR